MKKLFVSLCLLLILTPFYAQQKTAAQKESRLKLLFVGDIMGHGPQIKSAYDATTKTYNYMPVFKYVEPIISKADFAVGNLEVTLSGKGPYKGYPMFRSPDALATALRTSGFDMLVTANNHSNDGGITGINHTIDVLKGLGFYQTGTFKNEGEKDVYYPLIVYKKDFRIAFLNYTYGTNGIPTKSPTVVNLIDEKKIKADLDFTKKLKPDFTIVVMHWGDEYQLNESATQRQLAEKVLKWGGDMIIGAHPHVVQPIKKQTVIMADKTKKEGLVAYSLGNFISNQQKTNTDGGLMVEVELVKNNTTKKTTLGDYKYIPVWRYHNRKKQKNSYGTYHAVPIAAFENDSKNRLNLSASEKAKMASFAKKTRAHLAKHGAKERKITLADLGLEQPKGESLIDKSNSYKIIGTHNTERGYAPKPIKKSTPTSYAKFAVSRDTVPATSIPGRRATPAQQPTPYGQQPEMVKQKAYRIQFQTTQNMYDPANLPFKNIEVEQNDLGLFRYYTGTSKNLKDATVALDIVRNTGFKDAFITTYYKLVPKSEAMADPVEPMPPIQNRKSPQGALKGAVTYKIQVQSTRNFYGAEQPKLPFDDIEIQSYNGWFRYYVGYAPTLEEAKKQLAAVRAKGFPQAFVVTFIGGVRAKN